MQGVFDGSNVTLSNKDIFSFILTKFQSTLPSAKIDNVVAIENPLLWKAHMNHSDEIRSKQNGALTMVQWGFHGTTKDAEISIIRNGFDHRGPTSNGKAYGHGSYMSDNAKYANTYATADHTKMRHMIVVRLVAPIETVSGASTLKHARNEAGLERVAKAEQHMTVSFCPQQQMYPYFSIRYR